MKNYKIFVDGVEKKIGVGEGDAGVTIAEFKK